jgi:hypothetical protein
MVSARCHPPAAINPLAFLPDDIRLMASAWWYLP